MQYSLNGSSYSASVPTGTDATSYTVYYKVVGDNSHRDSDVATVEAIIGKAEIADFSLSGNSFDYTGEPIEPTVSVEVDSRTLTKDTDYTVEYGSNTAVGTATVTVSGINNYLGTPSRTFEIVPATPIVTLAGLTADYSAAAQALTFETNSDGNQSVTYYTDSTFNTQTTAAEHGAASAGAAPKYAGTYYV